MPTNGSLPSPQIRKRGKTVSYDEQSSSHLLVLVFTGAQNEQAIPFRLKFSER